MGFGEVLRYTAGKKDWLAADLPSEGASVRPRVSGAARGDVATCRPEDRLRNVRARAGHSPGGVVVVVNEARVVLGALDHERLDGDDDTVAEDAMDPGPVTYRPSLPIEQAADRMRESKRDHVLVTTGDGVLIGLFLLPGSAVTPRS